jgi:pantoate--beta-alanine ligase
MSSTDRSSGSAAGPRIVRQVRELQRWADAERAAGRQIALVPTMGALHEGHLSLVRRARASADRVVVSVFVNPTQFGPGEDLDRYPRDLDGDVAKLGRCGSDVVFAPSAGEMYPDGDCTWVEVEGLTDALCGRDRPGHFRGVATVVTRLLLAAKPHLAVFGEKDYQQLVVVRRLVRDLHVGVEILAAPTVREPDGLAMSSRNALLERSHREQARALNEALAASRELYRSGDRDGARLVSATRQRVEKEPDARVDYVELRCAETLAPLEWIDRPAILALAVRFGNTRLIDNTRLEEGR